jgi:hypothetical protein
LPLSGHHLALEVRCEPVEFEVCDSGHTLQTVEAVLYGATVTVDDVEDPSITGKPASELDEASWHSISSGALTVDAADNTGIRVRRVLMDGASRSMRRGRPGAGAGGCANGIQGLGLHVHAGRAPATVG